MTMMKKTSAICVLLAIFMLITSSVYAGSDSRVKQADVLKQLGLFTGTEQGYQLEDTFTRAQGTAMLLRLSGEEAEAVKAGGKPAFADVASSNWAAASIAYAVKKGYVKGVSADAFAPARPMSGKEFLTLLNRLLGAKDAVPANAAELSRMNGLLQAEAASRLTAASPFLRGDMIEAAYAALLAHPAGSKLTLLQTLVEVKGAVTAANAAASGLYAPSSAVAADAPDFYTPKPGTDPLDEIEEAIQQKLDGK